MRFERRYAPNEAKWGDWEYRQYTKERAKEIGTNRNWFCFYLFKGWFGIGW